MTLTTAPLTGTVIPAPKTFTHTVTIENGHAPTVTRHFGRRAVAKLTKVGLEVTHGEDLKDGNGFRFVGVLLGCPVALTSFQVRALLDDMKPLPAFTAKVGRQVITGQTLAEVSARYAELRDESGEGGSTWPQAVVRDSETLRVAGVVSYNGKVWAFDHGMTEAELIDGGARRLLGDLFVLSLHNRASAGASAMLFNPYDDGVYRAPDRFTPGQPVVLIFDQGKPTEHRKAATIVENIDASCAPLTDMWRVRTDEGGQFGFSGRAIVAAEDPSPLTPAGVQQARDYGVYVCPDEVRSFDTVGVAPADFTPAGCVRVCAGNGTTADPHGAAFDFRNGTLIGFGARVDEATMTEVLRAAGLVS